MDEPPQEWRSPGFGSLAASGFAFGLLTGLVVGIAFGGAVIWVASLIGFVAGGFVADRVVSVGTRIRERQVLPAS